jgi:hypothetical protein
LLLGPVVAVWWTLYHQDQKEKRTEKIRLFQTLMALRKLPPTPEWANALNLIDVVYSDHPKIVADWHAMYDILVQQQAGTERHNHAYLSLLSGMAAALGYDKLKQC